MPRTEQIIDMPLEGEGSISSRVYRFAMKVARPLFFLFNRFSSENAERYRDETGKPYLIVANHQSYLDPVFIMYALKPRRIRFISKDDVMAIPVFGKALAKGGAIPIHRDSADRTAIKRTAECLKRGEIVGVVPEGTRMKGQPGKERQIHAGAVMMASLAKADILPAAIVGAEGIWPYGKHFPRFSRVTVRFGSPLDLSLFDGLPRETRRQAIIDEAMRQVDELRAGKPLEEVDASFQERIAGMKEAGQ